MNTSLRLHLLLILFFLMNINLIFADSGGPLKPEQAAYDVNYYDLDLSIDPAAKTKYLRCSPTGWV